MCFHQLNTEWAQVEVVDLINDGSGLGFGIIGGRSTGVVVKTIVPGGVSDRVIYLLLFIYYFYLLFLVRLLGCLLLGCRKH